SSVLDDVPGLGPVRRKRLVKELGSVKALRAAPIEDLVALAWLPDSVAHAVYERLHAPAPTARPRRTPIPGAGDVSMDALLGRRAESGPAGLAGGAAPHDDPP